MMTAAILAGGLAKRLRPLTETIPKSLVPVNGEPFVAHQLRLLRTSGFERIVMCVGHMGEMVRDVVGDGAPFGLQVEYSWDGPVQLGTGGAITKALPYLGEEFFVMYGDSYLPCPYQSVEATFLAARKQGLMTVFRNEGQWDASNVEFRDGRIAAYDKEHRTPHMHHIDYGLGVFKRSVFAELPAVSCDLAAIYQGLLAHNELAAFEVRERFYEVGSFEGIHTLSSYLIGSPQLKDGVLLDSEPVS
ncbi:MAG TPA: nucleotidyltransferase family protein [Edaphobacter sp.]|nr:nucleotidyltransferase family protein [Edaphobacter sp.]